MNTRNNHPAGFLKATVVFYVLINLLLIPLIKTRKWKKIGIHALLFFLVLTGYEYFYYFTIINNGLLLEDGHFIPFLLYTALFDISKIFIALLFAMFITSYEFNKTKEELEKQKLKAEISAIKYQINPHFLFNSLSFIYTKTLKKNPEAAHAVVLFSEIINYTLDDWHELGKVPLALEVRTYEKSNRDESD